MFRTLVLVAALSFPTVAAVAQNTKGTGAESQTSTTTNPAGSVGLTTPRDNKPRAGVAPSTDQRRMDSTKEARDAYEKQGKSGASLR